MEWIGFMCDLKMKNGDLVEGNINFKAILYLPDVAEPMMRPEETFVINSDKSSTRLLAACET